MSDRSALIPLVESLVRARVLVVGDVMLDRYVTGGVERISPEAPIPVLTVESETSMLGGAGNVARNVAALGCRAALVGQIGRDAEGDEVRALVGEQAAIEDALVADGTRRTSTKTRYLGGTQQMLRADREKVGPLAPAAREGVLRAAREALAGADVMVVSDYAKGVLLDGVALELIAAAKAANKPVVVGPKGRDYGCYRGAHVVAPNRRELSEATGLPAAADDDIVAACRRLIRDHGFGAVLATRSRDGMTLVATEKAGREQVVHLKAEAREVFDVSGAGDTVVAAVAAALAAGAGLEDAARIANAAAGIVVGKVGTAVAHASEVIQALHHQDLSSAEAKVLSQAQALERIGVWRRQGLRIGFTNGCFDLLHPGHVSLLRQARHACDRLVVGLNSDASVRRLKGRERPIQSEAARGAVLASLASVDAVVIFADDTPLALIRAIRPDVLVKGRDWQIEEVVGADVVQGYGGRVLLAELEPGHSTSATIARLAKEAG
jgi:D-beta-D-heptose 7-phosphate kinase/D-beta-D-heptose 1-phosphate adenosyltransferase